LAKSVMISSGTSPPKTVITIGALPAATSVAMAPPQESTASS
jgi:hypothetical protein